MVDSLYWTAKYFWRTAAIHQSLDSFVSQAWHAFFGLAIGFSCFVQPRTQPKHIKRLSLQAPLRRRRGIPTMSRKVFGTCYSATILFQCNIWTGWSYHEAKNVDEVRYTTMSIQTDCHEDTVYIYSHTHTYTRIYIYTHVCIYIYIDLQWHTATVTVWVWPVPSLPWIKNIFDGGDHSNAYDKEAMVYIMMRPGEPAWSYR